jgi:hypothetical protein
MAAKAQKAANGDVSKDHDNDDHVAPLAVKNELSSLASQMVQLAPALIDYQSVNHICGRLLLVD